MVVALASLRMVTVTRGAEPEPPRYYAHPAFEDQHGVIVPWYTGQNGQTDFRVRIAVETLKRYPWTEPDEAVLPAPHFLYNGRWHIAEDGTISIPKISADANRRGFAQRDWHNGDLGPRAARIIFAMEEYYMYSGDPYAFGQVKLAADYVIGHCLTPDDHPWPGIIVSSPTRGELYGECDSHGFIQLDNVAAMGVALIHAYKMTQEQAYLDTALRWAVLFTEKADPQPGAAPWPRYANPEDVPWGSQPDGNRMTGGISYVLALLDELIALREVSHRDVLLAARDAGEAYLRDDLLPAWTDNPSWGYNYWDTEGGSSNHNVVYWTVRYILKNKARFPDWQTDVRNLMTIMLNRTSPNPTGRNGVYSGAWVHTESVSCCRDTNGYGPQRTCGLFLQYARETDSEWARELGRRMAILSSYDITDTGYIIDGLLSHQPIVAQNWFKIAVLNPIVFMIRNMAVLPEHLAPNRENHLLHASSTVQTIHYGDGCIEYRTFGAPAGGVDCLRLAFAPERIEADGVALAARDTLTSNGYSIQPLPGGDAIVRIRHDGARTITITGPDPQTVIDDADWQLDGEWSVDRNEQDVGGRAIVASAAGASATVTFVGNQVRIVGRCGPDGGRSDVYLDGDKQLCVIDSWSPAPKHRQILYYRNGLPPREHTLRIVARGQANPHATGTALGLDAAQVSAAQGDSGLGTGGGPTDAQRFILGYPDRRDYVDRAGHRWRPATEVICPKGPGGIDTVAKHWWTQPRADVIDGTPEPELYRYGMHAEAFTVFFTVGPGRYTVRIRLAETRPSEQTAGTMTITINGQQKEGRLNVLQRAKSPRHAMDLTYETIKPKNGVIEIRFAGNDGAEAIAQAVEVLPAD